MFSIFKSFCTPIPGLILSYSINIGMCVVTVPALLLAITAPFLFLISSRYCAFHFSMLDIAYRILVYELLQAVLLLDPGIENMPNKCDSLKFQNHSNSLSKKFLIPSFTFLFGYNHLPYSPEYSVLF